MASDVSLAEISNSMSLAFGLIILVKVGNDLPQGGRAGHRVGHLGIFPGAHNPWGGPLGPIAREIFF